VKGLVGRGRRERQQLTQCNDKSLKNEGGHGCFPSSQAQAGGRLPLAERWVAPRTASSPDTDEADRTRAIDDREEERHNGARRRERGHRRRRLREGRCKPCDGHNRACLRRARTGPRSLRERPSTVEREGFGRRKEIQSEFRECWAGRRLVFVIA